MAEEAGKSRDELLDEGERYFYDGEYEAALERFDQAVELDEDDPEAHYLRGRSLFYLSRDEEAERAYDRALDLAPDFAPALVHKAELYVRAFGWPDEALDLLDEASEAELTKDDRLEASFVRGIALMERGDYRQALEPLNRAVRGDPNWSEALRERGICRFYLWRFEDSLRDLERAVQLDADDAEAQYYVAMVYERLGREDEARRAYERAQEIDPNLFHVPHRMSREEFRRAAEEAIAQLPEEFRIRFDNLSFAVEDLPEKDEGVLPDVQGLFVGQPLPERSTFHPMMMPCRVLLFQKNLERIAPDLNTLKDEIGKTVLHEVGHFFGLKEEDMVRLDVH
jgi:Flp pilus assembly protein TadD